MKTTIAIIGLIFTALASHGQVLLTDAVLHGASFSTGGTNLSGLAGSEDTTNGFIGHWLLDDGTGTTAADATAYANNLELNGSATWVTGLIGNAVQFNGSQTTYLRRAAPGPATTGSHSFAVWVNPSTTNTATIFINGGSSDWSLISSIAYQGGTNTWMGSVVTTSPSLSEYTVSGGMAQTNVWSHYCLIFDNYLHKVILYINGTATATNDTGTVMRSADSYWVFGVNANYSIGFTGIMDMPRYYARALSATEVLAIYSNTK